MKFSHLHVHTQFSLLDGAANIQALYKKAIKEGMPAIAITDHGNMFGAFEFVSEAYKHTHADGSVKVKPVVGCEFYVVEDKELNAFALPGGKVFVNLGAIAKTNSEAELAGLLSHEIAHAALSHGFQLMTEGTATAGLTNLLPFGNLLGNCLYDKDYAKEVTKMKVAKVCYKPSNERFILIFRFV